MNYKALALVLLVILGTQGCRHGVNPNGPMAPMTLLTPQTKVPPPATGSYSIPGGYYQGQASNDVSTPAANVAQAVDQPIGSGLAQVSSNASPTQLPSWTDMSPRYSTTSDSGVQPASYSGQNPAGFAPTPVSYGDSAYVASTDSELRPQLRGMEVVDLTRSDKPVANVSPTGNSVPATPNRALPTTSPPSDMSPATRTDSNSLPWRDPLQ